MEIFDKPFEMQIKDIFLVQNKGIVLEGRVSKGVIKPGDIVLVNNNEFKVIAIAMFDTVIDHAEPGDDIGLLINSQNRALFSKGDWIKHKTNVKEIEPIAENAESSSEFTTESNITQKHMHAISNNKIKEENAKQDTLTELLKELNSLTGLTRVKEDVASTINLLKINEMRKQKGLHVVPVSNHMVFLGNPGTGKTTVARLLAKIYKELNVVSQGQFIETDRAGLVAGYVGQTALKTTSVVKKAIGGILFIDEAYSLTSNNDSSDYGNEAIDTLVKLMEDNRNDLVVIVAGYNDEMHNFIDSNPGLSSRFNRYFTFEDYSCDELIEIFKNICKKNGFVVSESGMKELKNIIIKYSDMARFGNARGVRNIFDKAIQNQADRLMKLTDVNKSDLTTIIASDFLQIDLLL